MKEFIVLSTFNRIQYRLWGNIYSGNSLADHTKLKKHDEICFYGVTSFVEKCGIMYITPETTEYPVRFITGTGDDKLSLNDDSGGISTPKSTGS